MSRINNRRKAFIIENQVYVSGGALYYINENGTIYFLMQKRWDKPYLEDIGGKSDPKDKSIEDIVKRETLEELNCLAPNYFRPKNNIITCEFLDNALQTCEQILIPVSKYVLFFVELPTNKRFELYQYRDAEYNKNGQIVVPRTLQWVNKTDFYKSNIHPRLNGIDSLLP